jgi:hypothetical protein
MMQHITCRSLASSTWAYSPNRPPSAPAAARPFWPGDASGPTACDGASVRRDVTADGPAFARFQSVVNFDTG